MPPSQTGGESGTPSTGGEDFNANFQLNAMVPTFDPAIDDVHVWSGKVELLLSVWPKTRVNELATRLILGCKGAVFMKLQLHRDAICINDPKGIKKLVEIVGGSWRQVPLEKKFELAEKALYKCIQKSDESSDSYLTRCDVVWTELLARNMQLSELQAYIMLRGSRLSSEDKKRVLVDSGAETGGNLEMSKVTAAVRMLGAGFFQELTGNRKDKSLKVYDTNAFVMDEVDESGENETFLTADDGWEDDYVDSLAAEYDDDASVIVQFEDAIMDTIAGDQELSTFFSTYQDARRRLAEKNRVRGFWPIRRSPEKGKKGGGKGKAKGKNQSLASRIANSYCRICFKRGHWKDECPNNPKLNSSGSTGISSSASSVAPTSFVTTQDLPVEIAHLPFAASVTKPDLVTVDTYFGETDNARLGSNRTKQSFNAFRSFAERVKQRLRQIKTPERYPMHKESRAIDKDCQSHKSQRDTQNHQEVERHESYFASSGTVGVVDLGQSQTVIGSQQIPELLQRLPTVVRNQVKRTDCNLVFRFGNHQTLTSRHAILLPILNTWFRIAIVDGNTPFLLSSEFLRKTLRAVIDTEQGTIWSKTLNKSLEVEVNSKNLFLMDISQLWSETTGHAQPVLSSQGYYKENKDALEESELEVIQWMALSDLRQERIAFGTAKKGMLFSEAFKDHSWTDWFVANYEKSKKVAHRKFVRFVELTLDEEMQKDPQNQSKEKSTAPEVMVPKAKMTATKSKAAPSKTDDAASWTQVDQVESEPDLDFAVTIEEEVCMMRAANREVSARLTSLEHVMQEVITHLKQFQVQVKTEP
eukprot:symbB.v1.2.040420.t1/scaffold7218.1/size12596/1